MVDQGPPVDAQCPSYAVALGYMGVAAAVCLSNWGSAVSSVHRRVDDSCFTLARSTEISKGVFGKVMLGFFRPS